MLSPTYQLSVSGSVVLPTFSSLSYLLRILLLMKLDKRFHAIQIREMNPLPEVRIQTNTNSDYSDSGVSCLLGHRTSSRFHRSFDGPKPLPGSLPAAPTAGTPSWCIGVEIDKPERSSSAGLFANGIPWSIRKAALVSPVAVHALACHPSANTLNQTVVHRTPSSWHEPRSEVADEHTPAGPMVESSSMYHTVAPSVRSPWHRGYPSDPGPSFTRDRSRGTRQYLSRIRNVVRDA